jgi:hypothetical protein
LHRPVIAALYFSRRLPDCFRPFCPETFYGKEICKAISDYLVAIHDKNRSFSHSFPLLLQGRRGLFRINALKPVSIGYNNAGVAFVER